MRNFNLFSLKMMMLVTIFLATSCTVIDNTAVPEQVVLSEAEKAELLLHHLYSKYLFTDRYS